MNYLEYYRLELEPFSVAPDTRFYYNSAQHSKALVRMMYAVDSMKGLALLIGDIGTGKTILARRMLDSLPEEEYESALLVIIHSGITAEWFLKRIAVQLGVKDPSSEKLTLLSQLYERLMQLHESGKKSVVLIDEAQMLQTREIMEEFRGLLNLEVPENKLITFVFFGLPELDTNLRLDEPLAQRVVLKYRLESFNEESSEAYIKHRLRLAGAKKELFEPEAIKGVHIYSRGIPRMINTICDNALFEGFLLKSERIGRETIDNVAGDLGLKLKEEKMARPVPSPEAPVAPRVDPSASLVEPPGSLVDPSASPVEPSASPVQRTSVEIEGPPKQPPSEQVQTDSAIPAAKKEERPEKKAEELDEIDSLLESLEEKD